MMYEGSASPTSAIERAERILEAAVQHSLRALYVEGPPQEVGDLFSRYAHCLTIPERRSVHDWADRELRRVGHQRHPCDDWEWTVLGAIRRATHSPASPLMAEDSLR